MLGKKNPFDRYPFLGEMASEVTLRLKVRHCASFRAETQLIYRCTPFLSTCPWVDHANTIPPKNRGRLTGSGTMTTTTGELFFVLRHVVLIMNVFFSETRRISLSNGNRSGRLGVKASPGNFLKSAPTSVD
jgi:hypothetical protein